MNRNSSGTPADRSALAEAFAQAREVSLGETELSQDMPLRVFVGASVTVCLFDRSSAWCGLRQVMLPSTARGHRQDAMLNADAALEDIFTRLCTTADIDSGDTGRKRIQAKIFGGAELNAPGLSFSDGAQSSSFVRSWLNTRHIPIAAESLGGIRRRELVLSPSNGVVYCRTLPIDEDFLNEERAKLSAAGKSANKIELF